MISAWHDLLGNLGIVALFAAALAFAYAIEFSQLYQADWINQIRQMRLGGLVLGFSFLPSDLVAYTIGIATGAGLDYLARKKWDADER